MGHKQTVQAAFFPTMSSLNGFTTGRFHGTMSTVRRVSPAVFRARFTVDACLTVSDLASLLCQSYALGDRIRKVNDSRLVENF